MLEAASIEYPFSYFPQLQSSIHTYNLGNREALYEDKIHFYSNYYAKSRLT